MAQFKKQFRGYNKKQVDTRLKDMENEINTLNQQIKSLEETMELLTNQNEQFAKQMQIQEKTNEEIARLALKEASHLIEKAKKNANMILKESMEYVRGLSKDMDSFKKEAIDFRANVMKMSEEMLETIDKSEIFSLIREEENTLKETGYNENL